MYYISERTFYIGVPMIDRCEAVVTRLWTGAELMRHRFGIALVLCIVLVSGWHRVGIVASQLCNFENSSILRCNEANQLHTETVPSYTNFKTML